MGKVSELWFAAEEYLNSVTTPKNLAHDLKMQHEYACQIMPRLQVPYDWALVCIDAYVVQSELEEIENEIENREC